MDNILEQHTREDIRCHRENGVSLNPYCTVGAMRSWQHGFDGVPKTLLDYDTPYQRGRLAAQLINEGA